MIMFYFLRNEFFLLKSNGGYRNRIAKSHNLLNHIIVTMVIIFYFSFLYQLNF